MWSGLDNSKNYGPNTYFREKKKNKHPIVTKMCALSSHRQRWIHSLRKPLHAHKLPIYQVFFVPTQKFASRLCRCTPTCFVSYTMQSFPSALCCMKIFWLSIFSHVWESPGYDQSFGVVLLRGNQILKTFVIATFQQTVEQRISKGFRKIIGSCWNIGFFGFKTFEEIPIVLFWEL